MTNYVDNNGRFDHGKWQRDQLIDEEITTNLNEGFATWEMSFSAMNLAGVELRPEKKYRVKARTTVEAIKKAAKMAGLKGNAWMATQTDKLIKLG
tara:strand:- start:307 stop:591 length:285 start_codon:yes stop_codon:yes gene_type:complete